MLVDSYSVHCWRQHYLSQHLIKLTVASVFFLCFKLQLYKILYLLCDLFGRTSFWQLFYNMYITTDFILTSTTIYVVMTWKWTGFVVELQLLSLFTYSQYRIMLIYQKMQPKIWDATLFFPSAHFLFLLHLLPLSLPYRNSFSFVLLTLPLSPLTSSICCVSILSLHSLSLMTFSPCNRLSY